MKRFSQISISVSLLIMIFFITQTLSQKSSDKTKAFKKSITLETKGNYRKALDEIIPFYMENKNNYIFNLRLGWLYYNLGKNDSSAVFYNTALNIMNSSSVEPMLGLVYPLAAMSQWDKVQDLYKRILELDPNNYTGNLRLGQIYLNKADYNNAKKYLEKVQSAYPGSYEPNLSLGWTYYYLGNYAKAKELLTAASMLDDKDSLAAEGLLLLK